ncbi:hypothetical protein AWRI1631_30480 [Saccharomyces cerevisiae AWRI1631]|uniref:Uncharacterized protein n=1 Tax=Saccharomyces cerevisiae (strain AWRI1631) TaxID=545124 RepID=B5VET8_YEAS6|nr:hypothetical protein AWRI1631_30480 [Saccharomyces cerevisiae AWRI1631]
MKVDLILSTNCTNFFNRLDDTDFIIDSHHRDETGIWSNGIFQFLQIDKTLIVHIQESDFKSLLHHGPCGFQDTLVFRSSGDDVFLSLLIKSWDTLKNHIIRFGRSRSEYYFLGVGIDHLCYVGSSIFHSSICFPTVRVSVGMRITIKSRIKLQHRIQNPRVCWCSGLHVKIYGTSTKTCVFLISMAHCSATRSYYSIWGGTGCTRTGTSLCLCSSLNIGMRFQREVVV